MGLMDEIKKLIDKLFDTAENVWPGNLDRELGKCIGKHYKIKTKADVECFEELWKLYQQSHKFQKDNKEKLYDEVTQAFNRVRRIAKNQKTSAYGFKHVKKLPLSRNYVIFSDHHIAYRGHKHDLFRRNAKLYRKILEEYYLKKDYTLVENGDVLEMLIFNPTVNLAKSYGDNAKSWPKIWEVRKANRLKQLDRIIDTYGSHFRWISANFHDKGRYCFVAGNHDIDLHKTDFKKVWKTIFPRIELADFLLIGDKGVPDFIVAHGHQFDPVTCPLYAPKLGEAISESFAWAFQGADRIWRWDDDSSKWAGSRGRAFGNKLATGKPQEKIAVWPKKISTKYLPKAFDQLLKWASEILAIKHEIAWEYFEDPLNEELVGRDLETQREWIKVRHMSETNLKNNWAKRFTGGKVPTLILGHTHEVRHRPVGQSSRPFPQYLNSGSAGRFENLIWAVEIEDATPRVVSWHFSEGPEKGDPVRQVWSPDADRLIVSKRSRPLAKAKSKTSTTDARTKKKAKATKATSTSGRKTGKKPKVTITVSTSGRRTKKKSRSGK